MHDPRTGVLAEKLKRLSEDFARLHEPGFVAGIHPETIVSDWYVAPVAALHLRGNVVGHPVLSDGPFESSELWYINEELKLARTLSRWFRLGEPLPGTASLRERT
jgi:hypothetical protein